MTEHPTTLHQPPSGLPSSAAAAPERQFLRHTVATLAYRAGKTIRDVPPDFGDYPLGWGVRTPGAILAHMGDLLDWALTMAEGRTAWRAAAPRPWAEEVDRFFAALAAFDAYLGSAADIDPEVIARLFQGPVADALTHTGQLALLRRCADAPVRPENYAQAEIVVGRTGAAQAAPRREFD